MDQINKVVDLRRESYRPFFPNEKAKWINNYCPPQLNDAVLSLFVSWHEASYTLSIPWLTVEQFSVFVKSHIESNVPWLSRLADGIKAKINNSPQSILSKSQKKHIDGIIQNTVNRSRGVIRNESLGISPDDYWNQLVTLLQFQVIITASQSSACCATFFAYESFLNDIYLLKGGDGDCYISSKRFWEYWDRCITPNGKAKYWDDPKIDSWRKMRNCMAHRGGKVSQELIEKHCYVYRDPGSGIISIGPLETKEMFDYLLDNVEKLLAELSA